MKVEVEAMRANGGGSPGSPGRGSKASTEDGALFRGGVCGRPARPATHWVLTLSSLPPAVSSQKRLQACPQQPAPSVPSCAAKLPLRPPARRLCPEHRPWQQRGPHPGSTPRRPGRQGQPSSQPQLGHARPLRPGCGPASSQWAQPRAAPAPQRAARRWWRRRQQAERRRHQ